MARVACVDKTPEAREALVVLLESATTSCRHSIGHLEPHFFFAASKEQTEFSKRPDIILIGPGYTIEETYSACKELKGAHPLLPVMILLDPAHYSLRTLKRLERSADSILLADDKPLRIIHGLEGLQTRFKEKPSGKLISCIGVKGGVGTTSIVSGLAHAAEAAGKTAIVIDLSPQAALPFYLGCPSKQSHDYRYMLTEELAPDKSSVKKMVSVAPNGIHVLLPPSGGLDVRELWLRHRERFEHSLSLIDYLREDYDLVIVDVGTVEGVLPFAITSQADIKLLVSSNTGPSVHLLRNALASLQDTPGEGECYVLISEVDQKAIHSQDIFDYLQNTEELIEEKQICPLMSYDQGAKSWIGTQNSFYSEGNGHTKTALEATIAKFFGEEKDTSPPTSQTTSGLLSTSKLLSYFRPLTQEKRQPQVKLAPRIEMLPQASKPLDNKDLFEEPRLINNQKENIQ